MATVDHNVPTGDRTLPIADEVSRRQVSALLANARDFGVELFDLDSAEQGIVHVIGPELGLTQPGMVIVCGDSHTSTHGAFGALAFGIGTSEVEHVMATQTIVQARPRTMNARFTGRAGPGVGAKDLILALIGRIGTAGATGYVIEYTGEAIRALSMEGRMTVCNMSIEAGARAGIISPDEQTVSYLAGRPRVPRGEAWERAARRWRALASDPGAVYDNTIEIDASQIAPQVSWGTSPGMVAPITDRVPDPAAFATAAEREAAAARWPTWGWRPGRRSPRWRSTASSSAAAPTPGSRISARPPPWSAAGGSPRGCARWSCRARCRSRPPRSARAWTGSSPTPASSGGTPAARCASGMNPDILAPGERCASTSNRNFEGRQGRGGRTHLMSPAMAAAAAVTGRLTDVRNLVSREQGAGSGVSPRPLPAPRSRLPR